MQKICTTLLFDVDDTLLDFHDAEITALAKLFESLNLTLNAEMKKAYHDFNQGLWKKLELGQITRDHLLNTRFTTFFKEKYGLTVDAKKASDTYLNSLALSHKEIDGAHELLTALKSKGKKLYVISNGVLKIQEKRLKDSGFEALFDDIFISEVIGVDKPDKLFFDRVTAKIDGFKAGEALVVGDSLTSDILGANNVKLDSVWFNPKKTANTTEAEPTYEVTQLKEILDLA